MEEAVNVSLVINGTRVEFAVSELQYNKYINELEPNKKTAPAKNFLMRTVKEESKEALKKLLNLPGAQMMILREVVEQYAPDLEITVGE